MPQFRYETISNTGGINQGEVEASSLQQALAVLNQRGIRPYFAEEVRTAQGKPSLSFNWQKPSGAWKVQFIRQMATLLEAGVTLDRALPLIAVQLKRGSELSFVKDLVVDVTAGKSLSHALQKHPLIFQSDELGILKAGEQSGSLVPTLQELASLLERKQILKRKISSALIYPAFLMCLAPISLIVIATSLVPNLAPLFENSEAPVPLAFSAMIWFSNEFNQRGFYWLLATLITGSLLYLFFKQKFMRSFLATLSYKMPMIGEIKRKTEAARICRTLGSLLKSGAPIQVALNIVTEVTKNPLTMNGLKAAREKVITGSKLALAAKEIKALSPTAVQMIAVGEETNQLVTMLYYVAEEEENALAASIDRFMTLLTPILTVALGLGVGGIVMSIMQAILSVNELAAK